MKIKANEPIKGGGSVGQYITYFSIDGNSNIATGVNWFDPDNGTVGIIIEQELIIAIGRGKTIRDSYIETIHADTMEWGIVVHDKSTP